MNGVTTQHILDGADVVADITNAETTTFIRGLGLVAMISPTESLKYLTDGHGDVVGMTNAGGSVVRNYTYDAFGVQENEVADGNPFRYCGEYTDWESGNVYLRARYYDPGIGRFVSEDTYWNIDNMIYGEDCNPSMASIMQSGNLYAYCSGDPINRIDPLGYLQFELYDTIYEAAVEWAFQYYGLTDFLMLEIGGILYSQVVDGKTMYGYTWGVVGTPHGVNTSDALEWVPEGAVPIGTIHSHMPHGTRGFSPVDTDFYNMNPTLYKYYFVVSKDPNSEQYELYYRTSTSKKVMFYKSGSYMPIEQERRKELRNRSDLRDKWYQSMSSEDGKHFGNGKCVHGNNECAKKTWPNPAYAIEG